MTPFQRGVEIAITDLKLNDEQAKQLREKAASLDVESFRKGAEKAASVDEMLGMAPGQMDTATGMAGTSGISAGNIAATARPPATSTGPGRSPVYAGYGNGDGR
jgi:hypothetical protein